jgi:Tfp pilus assembly protein PilO
MLEFYSSISYGKKIALSAAFSFLIIGVISYFLIIPAIDNIKLIKSEIEAMRIELEKNYLKGKSLKVTTEDLKTVEPQLEKLKNIFIKKEDGLEFVTELEKTAQNNHLEQKINLSSEEKDLSGICKKIPLQLSTNGNFTAQMKYLTDLESLNYYINLKTIELSSAGTIVKETGEKESQINLQLIADTYWQE